MNHIRVGEFKFVNPDRFDSIGFEPETRGQPAKVVLRRDTAYGGEALEVKGADGERLWKRMTGQQDALEAKMATFDEIERKQQELMQQQSELRRMLGLLDGAVREYAGAEGGG